MLMAAIDGIGFTTMFMVIDSPTHPSKLVVAIIVAVCVDEELFSVANEAMLPVPEAGSPIEVRLFIQLMFALDGVDAKLIAVVFAPAQRV